MPKLVVAGYPSPPGNKQFSELKVTGPTLYTVITIGSPPTGGQIVNASDFGLVSLEGIIVLSASDNGQYGVEPVALKPDLQGCPQYTLMWFTLITGAQVGAIDLSARSVRLLGIGV